MKPSDARVRTYIRKCPLCGRVGYMLWYIPLLGNGKDNKPEFLELVIQHGLGKFKGHARNNFHYTGVFRSPGDEEIRPSWRAYPTHAPDLGLLKLVKRVKK